MQFYFYLKGGFGRFGKINAPLVFSPEEEEKSPRWCFNAPVGVFTNREKETPLLVFSPTEKKECAAVGVFTNRQSGLGGFRGLGGLTCSKGSIRSMSSKGWGFSKRRSSISLFLIFTFLFLNPPLRSLLLCELCAKQKHKQ